jgi:arylsulfatase A-like enzyme
MNREPPIFPILACAALAACSPAAAGTRQEAEKPRGSLLVITLDTTRRDHMGFLGKEPSVTPSLDALAAESVVFEDAWTVAPLTLPAHVSLMTGLYPASHRVRDNGLVALSPAAVTLAETLHDAGWATAAGVSAAVLDRSYGLAQGFDRYRGVERDPGKTRIFMAEKPANATVDQALAELGSLKPPWFLWVHLFDAHFPYQPPTVPKNPAQNLQQERAENRRLYGEEIRFDDREVGRLLDALRARPEWKDLTIVVAADHGESLCEAIEETHGWFVYDPTMRIPLVVRSPGAPPHRVKAQASLIDVMPTVLSLLGQERPDLRFDGVDLAPLVRGETDEAPDRALALESWYAYANFGWAPHEAVVRGPLKYLRSRREKLFDRASDPGEKKNLFTPSEPRAKALRLQLDQLLAAPASPLQPDAIVLDEQARADLQALGYVEASVLDLSTRPDSTTLEDAEDHVDVLYQLEEITAALQRGEYDNVVRFFRRLCELAPRSCFAHEQLAGALMMMRKPELNDEAEKHLRAVLAIDFHRRKAHFQLGLLEQRRSTIAKTPEEASRHRRAAIVAYRFAVEADPGSPESLMNLVTVLRVEERSLPESSGAERRKLLEEADSLIARFLAVVPENLSDRPKVEEMRADVRARLATIGPK